MTETMAANQNPNPMRNIEVEKVVINMGVGESGEKLAKAEKLLEHITSQKPIELHAKKSLQPLSIKKGEAIACKVTLRKDRAKEFLKRCFKIQDKLFASQFDTYGNFSFGIAEHTDFGIRYDPKVGIYGMDVSVSLKRPGYRIKERKIQKRKVPSKQRISKEEGMAFLEKEYGVEVVEE